MNIAPITQNNNSLSFGMALKLEKQGAREIATLIEEVSPVYATLIEDTLEEIHAKKQALPMTVMI